MRFERGIASIPMIVGLVIMAIAIPVAGKLALNNQDIRNRAAGTHPVLPGCSCVSGKYTGANCAVAGAPCATGTAAPTARPTTVIRFCTMDSQCGGQSCFNGLCKSRCTATSECGTGKKCSSGHCLSGCVSDSGCTSEGGKCSSGVCVGLPLPTASGKRVNGSACTLDGDCASTHCIGNYPNRKCAASENNRPNGADCILPSVCTSGKCSKGKCVAQVVPSGTICGVNGCVTQAPQRLPVGGKCYRDEQCGSRNCSKGKCQSPKKEGETCATNRECQVGLTCKKFKCAK